MQQAAPVTSHKSLVTDGGTPSWYRIQDPASQLYVRLKCCAPRVTWRLDRRDRASRFPSHGAAALCFSIYLAGQTLDIVRCDA